MKSLKLNQLFFSVLALMAFSILMTSCTKESDTVMDAELTPVSTEALSQELAENPSFIATMNALELMNGELMNFIRANDEAIAAKPAILDEFAASLHTYKATIESHALHIVKDFPQLITFPEEGATEVVKNAIQLQKGIVSNGTRSCVSDCNDFYNYLDAQDYAAYLSQVNYCVQRGGDYNACNASAYAWYLQANASNVNTYYACVAGC